MKSRLSKVLDGALWLGATLIIVAALWPKQSGPGTGTTGAAFSLPLVGESGNFVYAQPRDKPLLIEAFASWCGSCRRSAGILSSVHEAEAAGKLDIVAVSVDDDPSAALQAKRTWPIPVTVAHDSQGDFQRSYDVSLLPTFILLDTEGKVSRVTSGVPGASDVRHWLNASD